MTEPLRWGIISTGGIARTFVNDLQYTESGVAVAVVHGRWRPRTHSLTDSISRIATARTKSW